MARLRMSIIAAIALTGIVVASPGKPVQAELAEQVRATELAFAKTMADRDHEAFTSFLADEAVFLEGQGTLRGKAEIAAGWKRYYEGETAPFSWVPTTVEILQSGTLAFSTGPVRDAAGKSLGTYNSVWRKEANGSWKIVFDKGSPPACEHDRP